MYAYIIHRNMDPASLNDPAIIDRQVEEFLYYKRLLLQQQIHQRTDARVKQLAAKKTGSNTYQTTDATGKVLSVTSVSADTPVTSSASRASAATHDDLNGDRDYIKIDRASWKQCG